MAPPNAERPATDSSVNRPRIDLPDSGINSEITRAGSKGKRIPLAAIKDGGAQMRVEMHPTTVHDYADDMLAGAVFPPVIIYFDGTDYWLADGYHRVEAARKISLK
jgi:uncharacterized protein (DUF1015 family)